MPHPPEETWRKVGVRPGDRVVLLHAPERWGDPPAAGRVSRRRTPTPADVVVAFFDRAASLRGEAAALVAVPARSGVVWVAWPRKAAGHVSDLSDAVVRATLLPHGVVDVKVAMLDEDWSGLKFVWRRDRR